MFKKQKREKAPESFGAVVRECCRRALDRDISEAEADLALLSVWQLVRMNRNPARLFVEEECRMASSSPVEGFPGARTTSDFMPMAIVARAYADEFGDDALEKMVDHTATELGEQEQVERWIRH